MEIVKKYNNRKLYSTSLSRYVNMEYIIDLVRTNQKFKVIESGSDLDITNKTVKGSLLHLPLTMETMSKLIREKK